MDNTATATVNPLDNVNNFLALLSPARQHMLCRERNFMQPQVHLLGTRYDNDYYYANNRSVDRPQPCENKQRRKIIIRDFPVVDNPSITTALEGTPIIQICHQMKHLYADGNHDQAIRLMQEKAHEVEIKDVELRMYISYTYVQRWTKDGYSDLELKFYLNHSDDDKHFIISRIPRDQLSVEQIREFRRQKLYRHCLSSKSVFTICKVMEPADLDYFLDIFVYNCFTQITDYVSSVYNYALRCHLLPDYTMDAALMA